MSPERYTIVAVGDEVRVHSECVELGRRVLSWVGTVVEINGISDRGYATHDATAEILVRAEAGAALRDARLGDLGPVNPE